MKLTDKALLDYWKKFRSECDILIERDINGAIAEQIIMTDATIEMIGTIEAQQQEIEQLKTAINAQGKEIIKRGVGNVKLQQENERLKVKYDKLNDFEQTQCVKLLAHNGAMREALQNAIWDIRSGYLASIGSLHNTYTPQISVKRVDDWEKALSTTFADYHNPADEITIKESPEDDEILDEALAYHNPADVALLKQALEDMALIAGDVISEKKCYICQYYTDGEGCELDGTQFYDNGECHFTWRGDEKIAEVGE